MMKKREKKRTLRTEITIRTMLISVCMMLLVCASILCVFFSFFYKKTQKDIEYVLTNISRQFQSHMQFIEDGAVSVRHNAMLEDFFSGEVFERSVAEAQLSYSMELFSDRNTIERYIPFVTSVYLFNNRDDCVYEHYYASTVALEKLQEERYARLQRQFKKSSKQYQSTVDEKSMNLCFRIYGDDMEERGICIAEISRDAVGMVLSEVTAYKKGCWAVLSADGQVIDFYGEQSYIEKLKTAENGWQGKRRIDGETVIGCADISGFGIRSVITVGQENIFFMLTPTMLIMGSGLLLALVATGFASFGASYRFIRPITRMIESIRAFGRPDLDVRMENASIQEFHDIGIVFNEMADRIKYLITQVYEKQILATQSQVKYLQAQINPHFQFNILAMLGIQAKMAGNEEVYEGLQAFSKLVQGKIFREKEIKIKVSEELEIVRFYLYLQSSRFRDKISYEIVLEDEAINEDLIPRLLIEPLVENAVSHGLEPKRGHGIIKVHLYESREITQKEEHKEKSHRKNRLHICVEDDGVGFDAEKIIAADTDGKGWIEKQEHTHTGLENTKRLLQILYGDEHEFKISGGKGKGTKIEIVLLAERSGEYVEGNGCG